MNASVTYDTSILNLVMPLKKDLVIGLGLVNQLSLSEFKAVLAHEFGHFSQSSLRLGVYVYTANRIIGDMVYARDFFDDLLRGWRRLDIRLSFIAWILYGIVWVLRKILEAAFKGINFVDASLSRQMEFHADLVAVSVCGSDMIVHALKRLEFADACMDQTSSDLKEAFDHKLCTSNLYYHQELAGSYLRAIREEPDLGVVPALPEDPTQSTVIFDESDRGIPSMWASHPSNFDREQNAKRRYVRSLVDDRPAWTLFRDREALCTALTHKFYEEAADLAPTAELNPVEQVQAFIDGEHAETRQDPRYLGIYDGRLLSIEPPEFEQCAAAIASWPRERLQQTADRLYKAEYKDWFGAHQERYGEYRLLSALDRGEIALKGKTLPFRDQERRSTEVPKLLEMVDKELEADTEWFKQFDLEIFQAHLMMSRETGAGTSDLVARYRFQLHLQQILSGMNVQLSNMSACLSYAEEKREGLKEGEMNEIRHLMGKAREALVDAMNHARTMPVPPLQNMEAGAPLSEFLLTEAIAVEPITYRAISGEWVGKLMGQLSQVHDRAKRLHFKSLGALLGRQEAIAEAWMNAPIPSPQVPPLTHRSNLEYDF